MMPIGIISVQEELQERTQAPVANVQENHLQFLPHVHQGSEQSADQGAQGCDDQPVPEPRLGVSLRELHDLRVLGPSSAP